MKIHTARRMEHRTLAGKRCGYTLIEMIIASVLVVTLMSASWSLLSLYSGFLTAGREQASTRQLARSLLSILSDDLRNVAVPRLERVPVRQPVHFAGGSTDDRSDSPADFAEASPGHLPVTESAITGTLELIGRPDSIRLIRRQLSGGASLMEVAAESVTPGEFAVDSDSPVSEQPRMPEVVTVVYQFEAPHVEQPDSGRLPGGLHRIEVGLRQWLRAEESRDDRFQESFGSPQLDYDLLQFLVSAPVADADPSLPGQPWSEADVAEGGLEQDALSAGGNAQHEHIPEAVHCQFRYFDGAGWVAAWDSRSRGTFPAAVQIEFSLLSAGDLRVPASTLNTGTIENSDSVSATMIQNPADSSGVEGDGYAEQLPAAPFPAVQPRNFRRIVLLAPETAGLNWSGEGSPLMFRESSEGRMAP